MFPQKSCNRGEMRRDGSGECRLLNVESREYKKYTGKHESWRNGSSMEDTSGKVDLDMAGWRVIWQGVNRGGWVKQRDWQWTG